MLLDRERLIGDKEYWAEARFRCQTDHIFLAHALGWAKISEAVHRPVADFYVQKSPGLPLEDQDPIKFRMHLWPRLTYKTTMGMVDSTQWVTVDPDVTITNLTATQPLAQAMTDTTVARAFIQPKGKAPTLFQICFPEHVVERTNSGEYNSPARTFAQLDKTLDSTSVKSTQTGWHPWVLNPDDPVDTENSGITATANVRQGVIAKYNTNLNTLQRGGYVHMRGTRYHPFELWGHTLETMDPKEWKVLISAALRVKSGQRLQAGEFPPPEEVELLFPEMLSYEELRSKFNTDYETFMCFKAGARVLMDDWTERPIEELKVGDGIVGFRKIGPRQMRLTREKVEKVFSRKAAVAKVTTDSGRVTYPTFDHRFLRPLNGGELIYRPLKVGSQMVSVYKPKPKPTAQQQRYLDWIGGLIDGEGSVGDTAALGIYQKQTVNPEVCATLLEALAVLRINVAMGLSRSTDRFGLHGGRSLKIYLLQHAMMAKKERFSQALWNSAQLAESSGRAGGGTYPTVASMEPIGEHTVYDIQSSSGNFVCDGFAVHNCQQMNDPQGGSLAQFPIDLYRQTLMQPDRIPQFGEVSMFWRFPYGGKEFMAKYAEGVAVRIANGHAYVIDAWQGMYTQTGLAEKVVKVCQQHQVGIVEAEDSPGARYLEGHIKNESYRRNVSIRMKWAPFEENDADRFSRMEQLEPMMRSGRLSISTEVGKPQELRRQFIHYRLITENGLVDTISRLAMKVPVSLLRTELDEEELDAQRRRREQMASDMVWGAAGQAAIEEQEERKRVAEALAAIGHRNSYGLPDILGGLDG